MSAVLEGPQEPDSGLREGPEPTPESNWAERLEASPVGRVLLSAVIVCFLAAIVLWNLPESEMKRRLVPFFMPAVFSIGLDQSWSVFAPEPQLDTFEVTAKIEYADQSTTTWKMPGLKGLYISPYRIYRWRKYAENVRLDTGAHLWEPFARWIAVSQATEGIPVRVTLVRRWRNLHPPGEQSPPPEWFQHEFFVFNVLEDRPE